MYQVLRPDRKEAAFYKLLDQEGGICQSDWRRIILAFGRFDVSLSPDEPCGYLRINGSADEALLWSMETLEPAPIMCRRGRGKIRLSHERYE